MRQKKGQTPAPDKEDARRLGPDLVWTARIFAIAIFCVHNIVEIIALNGRERERATSARPMAISRHILLRSVAVSRLKHKRSGRWGYSRIRSWS